MMRSLKLALAALLSPSVATDCRCLPGDACWPAASEWQQLNETVNGRLIATVPLAAPCHDPAFGNSSCEALRANWQWPEGHYESPSSVMAPFFANQSCDPFTSQDTPCQLGNYVRYAISVSSSDHVAAGIQFAKDKNIRLVVRNTGHDYNGKSTGAGALAIWTHRLKSVSIIDYTSPAYSGNAIKVVLSVSKPWLATWTTQSYRNGGMRWFSPSSQRGPWNFTAPWEAMVEWQDKLTNNYIPQLTALAPESGCYSNEGDFRQPNWQKYFYGSNYAKLRETKKQYDPSDLFYGVAAVGSEEWTVAEDGRMCRAGNSTVQTYSRSTRSAAQQEVMPEL